MKLLGTPTNPYVRKVRLMLLEKNIPHEYLIDPPREPGSLVVRNERILPVEQQEAGNITLHNNAISRPSTADQAPLPPGCRPYASIR